MGSRIDLNFPPISEQRPANQNETSIYVLQDGLRKDILFDLNIDPLDGFVEEEPQQGHEKIITSTIAFDLNQPPARSTESLLIEDEISNYIDIENDSNEEALHHGQEELSRNIDLNQDPPNNNEVEPVRKKNKMLNNEERRKIYLALLKKSIDGRLRKGTTRNISNQFSVSTRTVMRIWKQSKNPINGVVDVSHRKTKNCGRKRIEIDREKFHKIPLSQRTCLRIIACTLNVSKSTLHRHRKSGDIRRHSNPVKPFLKESNKRARVEFCLSMLDRNSIPHDPKFVGMYNVIHIDDKWFYISKKTEKYYLLSEECDPERSCKSKNFLTKIMFLAAMVRPRFDSAGNVLFSGKIGIFPFVTKQPAKRSSANRMAGTLETKPMTSIGKDTCRSFLIDKVLPAILEKWPDVDMNFPIFIQQDNARTHIDPNDEEFRSAVARLGLNVHLTCQPPNSPDLNILDLGFFAAIQSLQYKVAAKNIDELISAVEEAFDVFPSNKVNYIFLTLQECMIEIMKSRGSNGYKIPHMNKTSLERSGRLPTQIPCDAKLVEEVIEWLKRDV